MHDTPTTHKSYFESIAFASQLVKPGIQLRKRIDLILVLSPYFCFTLFFPLEHGSTACHRRHGWELFLDNPVQTRVKLKWVRFVVSHPVLLCRQR